MSSRKPHMQNLDFVKEAGDLFSYTQKLRRDFHQHPELGFREMRTSSIVARELSALGLEVTSGIAETGVAALVEGAQPGKVVLLRFDMDALPIQEETGAPYASQNPGVMHACGHDGHVAIGLAVARMLHSHRDRLAGTVKLVFQPAEEGLGGARRMIDAGILENPRPDAALALHIWNERPLGWIGVTPGAVMAAADIFQIQVKGKGGHGAIPDQAVDPVAASAQIITTLQTILARNISPLDAAVISVTSLKAGEAFNVIPSEAALKGTIRTFNPDVRERILERCEQIAVGVGRAMGCQVDLDIESITPPVVNDPEITSRVQAAAAQLFPDASIDSDYRSTVSEDMAFLLAQTSGCFFFIGSANQEKNLDAGHHHPRFDFDEQALVYGTALMAAAAVRVLDNRA